MQRYEVFSDWTIFLFSATNGCRFISAQYFFSSAVLPLILRPCYGVASLLGVEQDRRMAVGWVMTGDRATDSVSLDYGK